MKNVLLKCFRWQWFVCMAIGCCFSSCKDDDESSISTYDPSKPIELTDFYPKTGPISTQVILNGSNFGNDKSKVKVFFNEKEAPVISVKGERVLALAPKLPGDECTIKVQIGDQTLAYKDLFDYVIQTNISTLVGGDTSYSGENPEGTCKLSEAQFKNKIELGIVVDASKNVYFCMQRRNGNDSDGLIYVLNEEADQLKSIKQANYFCNNPMLAYDPYNDKVYSFETNATGYGYSYFDALNGFTEISQGSFAFVNGELPSKGMTFPFTVRRAFAMNENGRFYCRGGWGEFYYVDPYTKKGEILHRDDNPVGTKDGDTYGAAFDPHDSNIFYFSNEGKHCIYKYNISTRECEVFAGIEGKNGYLDGKVAQAMFNRPCQICFDSEGDMYVADRDNHCIRKIAMSTKYVSTVAGIAGKSGYKNGTNEEALFNKPIGLAVDSEGVLYVGDSENRAIRRIAIE